MLLIFSMGFNEVRWNSMNLNEVQQMSRIFEKISDVQLGSMKFTICPYNGPVHFPVVCNAFQ